MNFEIDDDFFDESDWPPAIGPRRDVSWRGWLLGGLLGCLTGAALAYFLDPDRGRRRRVMFADQFHRRLRVAGHWASRKQRHFSHVLESLPHRLTIRLASGVEEVDDGRLIQRIRARMGRVTRYPGAIQVAAARGRVSLSGPVLGDEVERLVKCVRSVPGVRRVVNNMRTHSRGAVVPGLQGEGGPRLNA